MVVSPSHQHPAHTTAAQQFFLSPRPLNFKLHWNMQRHVQPWSSSTLKLFGETAIIFDRLAAPMVLASRLLVLGGRCTCTQRRLVVACSLLRQHARQRPDSAPAGACRQPRSLQGSSRAYSRRHVGRGVRACSSSANGATPSPSNGAGERCMVHHRQPCVTVSAPGQECMCALDAC